MIEEGESRKSPQNKSNQTNQVDNKENTVVLQVHAESKELERVNIPNSATNSRPVAVLNDISPASNEIALALVDDSDIYENKQSSKDEDSDSSSDSSDDCRLQFDWSSLLPKKKGEEVVIPINTVLSRFYNDDPSLRLDALPLKVLKNLNDVLSKKPEYTGKTLIFDPACRLKSSDAAAYFGKYTIEHTLKDEMFDKVAFSILHSRDYDLLPLVTLTQSPVALFEVKDELGNFNTTLIAKNLLEAQLEVGVVHMDESVLSNHRVADSSTKDITNTKAIRWVLGNFDLPADVLVAITPTHFKVERLQKKHKTKKSDVSKSVSESDVSTKNSKSDNSEPIPKGDAPEKKKEMASDKSALQVTRKVTQKNVKGPLFKMTKIVKGAFVEEIAPEKIVEIRALAESIVEKEVNPSASGQIQFRTINTNY